MVSVSRRCRGEIKIVFVMFRLIAENSLLLQKLILWRKIPVKFYYYSDFLTIKILSDVK